MHAQRALQPAKRLTRDSPGGSIASGVALRALLPMQALMVCALSNALSGRQGALFFYVYGSAGLEHSQKLRGPRSGLWNPFTPSLRTTKLLIERVLLSAILGPLGPLAGLKCFVGLETSSANLEAPRCVSLLRPVPRSPQALRRQSPTPQKVCGTPGTLWRSLRCVGHSLCPRLGT